MALGEICNRTVVVVTRGTRLDEAARLMREHHVGSLVVVDETAIGRRPVGIITDRDIVIEVAAMGVPLATVTAEEAMAPDLMTGLVTDPVWDTVARMREKGVRRLPVVDRDGVLQGILTVDDLLELLTEHFDGLVRTIIQEQTKEARSRR
ncbi:MAG: CBS domain-containing protein [Betaproteobacteria bacterium]|nr:CBS domain-containing protein [Betaproteobacteria bacterium]